MFSFECFHELCEWTRIVKIWRPSIIYKLRQLAQKEGVITYSVLQSGIVHSKMSLSGSGEQRESRKKARVFIVKQNLYLL